LWRTVSGGSDNTGDKKVVGVFCRVFVAPLQEALPKLIGNQKYLNNY
jgi:hypothetical protein